MPRNQAPETRADSTPGKMPVAGGDRGQGRPAAGRTNARKVQAAARRDEALVEEE